jgi:hypothetical protein
LPAPAAFPAAATRTIRTDNPSTDSGCAMQLVGSMARPRRAEISLPAWGVGHSPTPRSAPAAALIPCHGEQHPAADARGSLDHRAFFGVLYNRLIHSRLGWRGAGALGENLLAANQSKQIVIRCCCEERKTHGTSSPSPIGSPHNGLERRGAVFARGREAAIRIS